jgi:8-oxo-dGTP pyrophosphatase MutT (NUDIX family)
VQAGELLAEAVVRELEEETGIEGVCGNFLALRSDVWVVWVPIRGCTPFASYVPGCLTARIMRGRTGCETRGYGSGRLG